MSPPPVATHPFAEEVDDRVVDVVTVAEIWLGEESKQTNGSNGLMMAAAKQAPANAGKVRSFISRDELDYDLCVVRIMVSINIRRIGSYGPRYILYDIDLESYN